MKENNSFKREKKNCFVTAFDLIECFKHSRNGAKLRQILFGKKSAEENPVSPAKFSPLNPPNPNISFKL